ncbi:histidyl-tRNA synthetase [Fistulina hepatica ATCC 64428]|uniref:histidine--tRNA ligase n=1 Tax=Fistulina hepatica ATCC 64428 TaxID=1128425 RepID=A0A0D7AF47_9AGAR|nr:histidyl-tRNA synthetase [Fistulina hepatica ATCC 64428]
MFRTFRPLLPSIPRRAIPASYRRFSKMAATEDLQREIQAQTAIFNDLRLKDSNPGALDEAKKKLGDLKRALGVATAASGSGAKDGKKKERLLLKTAKGTRDFGPGEMYCREYVERVVKDCFTSFGGSCLDTPVFERKDVLTGKYGEDSKLIFDLMDQGGEQLALRYDHTVPLARYLAMLGGTNTHSKIWQVGKVYRRDNPVMSKGRMREFSQADFDISGVWDPMVPDAEIVSLMCTILTKLEVGDFTVKLNNRKILDGMFEVCGVSPEKIRTISSAVDKLDKSPWSEVKHEMTEEKGLDEATADKIGEYVKLKGGPELLDRLTTDTTLMSNVSAKDGIVEMGMLFKYLRAYKVIDKVSFDLSLARGLDYYTGLIFEAVVAASAPPGFSANANATPAPEVGKKSKRKKAESADDDEEIDESQVGVGSIAAGGRYDKLVGMFHAAAAGEGKKAASVPCVGVSMGLDRIFALLWPTWAEKGMRSKETMVYVMAAGDGLLEERIALVQELRAAGIKTDFLAKVKPKLPAQFAAGERDEVPFAVILGADELQAGLVTVKEQRWAIVDGKKAKVESADKGVQVRRDELVDWIKRSASFQSWSSGKLIA